jgi:HEAT repeat protein/beta-lactamase regulating signal transducer with metallopeptidase domain
MIDAMIQSAVLFALVAIVTRLLKRRASASLRHMFWAFAIVSALVAPLIARLSPLEFSVMPKAAQATWSPPASSPRGEASPSPISNSRSAGSPAAINPTTTPIDDHPAGPERRIAWAMVIAIAWGVGTLALLARIVFGLVAVHRIARRAVEVTDPMWHADIDRCIAISGVRQPVEVRMSADTPVPYTCGLVHPIIVLPRSAGEWSPERRDAVLLHELAHISRGDLAMNIISHLTRALYWPNPLAWHAANGLRFEGERAADDAVLAAGAKPSAYADHLLDIVKSVGQPVPRIALAMARSSDFEGRLLAILEPGVPRTRMSRARMAGVAALFMVALVPVTAMTTAPATPVIPDITQAAQPPAANASNVQVSSTPPAAPETPRVSTPPVVVTSSKPMNRSPLPQASAMILALGETLGDRDADVRLAAVNSLGGLQDPAAIAALAEALKKDTDARVREAAAWALGEIDDNRAVPHLLEALKAERSSKVRVKIVEALEQIDDASAVGGVSGVLKDPSVEVRRAAVDALGEFEDVAAIPALASMIHDDDVEVRRNVANALGQFHEAGTVDPLTAMTKDRDAEVRANAIEGLSQFESMNLVSVFVAALKDSSAHVREHAASALGDIDELKTAPRALIDALADPNRDVRQQAASALANIGDEAAVPGLKKLVSDTDTDTRREAVEALKEIGGAEAVTALMGLLKDPDPEVRKSAAEALGRKRP